MPWKGRELGISRQVGYDWVRRYRDADFKPAALKERSRRPHTTPSKVDESMESVIVETRKSRPTLGAEEDSSAALGTISDAERHSGGEHDRRSASSARVCYPLTIIDAHSRFLIRCEGVEDPNGREVQPR